VTYEIYRLRTRDVNLPKAILDIESHIRQTARNWSFHTCTVRWILVVCLLLQRNVIWKFIFYSCVKTVHHLIILLLGLPQEGSIFCCCFVCFRFFLFFFSVRCVHRTNHRAITKMFARLSVRPSVWDGRAL